MYEEISLSADSLADNIIVAEKVRNHFLNSYSANNARRDAELRKLYFNMRDKYCGFPLTDDNTFDTESVSRHI